LLHDSKFSRSSINNYCSQSKKYYEMHGKAVDFNFVRPMNTIPHFFDENDVAKLFAVCHNIKHQAMLQTLFYGCLRAGELCTLDDCDVDLKSLTLRVEGKGGKEAIVYITDECAKILKRTWKYEVLSRLMDEVLFFTPTLVGDGNAVVYIACLCTTRSSQESRSMAECMYSRDIALAAFW
jgi:integrase